MGTGQLAALAAGASVLLVMSCVLLAVVRSGRRTRQALDASRADVAALHARLDSLSGEIESARVAAAAAPAVPQTEYLITTAGVTPSSTADATANTVVLSATVGEPLVKVVAFGYGVRRALAPRTRNRIAFEMRREVKRARKQRKRDLRLARRTAHEAGRGAEAAA